MRTIQKQELGMCKKVRNTCKQLPLTAGYWLFEKLRGSIENKFPYRYFLDTGKKQKLNNMGL